MPSGEGHRTSVVPAPRLAPVLSRRSDVLGRRGPSETDSWLNRACHNPREKAVPTIVGGFYREVRIPNLPKGLHLGGAFWPGPIVSQGEGIGPASVRAQAGRPTRRCQDDAKNLPLAADKNSSCLTPTCKIAKASSSSLYGQIENNSAENAMTLQRSKRIWTDPQTSIMARGEAVLGVRTTAHLEITAETTVCPKPSAPRCLLFRSPAPRRACRPGDASCRRQAGQLHHAGGHGRRAPVCRS